MSIASAVPPPSPGPPALFALMASQHGVASSAQARLAGVSCTVEQRLIADGALVRPLPGIVAAGGIRQTFEANAMAASLCAGVLAVSHGAAARLHGLAGFEDHPDIDVLGRRGSHLRALRPVVSHYSRGPIEQHLVRAGAIPVTSIPLTLALITNNDNRSMGAVALDDALSRNVPAATIRAVALQWRERGRPGPGALLTLLDRIDAG